MKSYGVFVLASALLLAPALPGRAQADFASAEPHLSGVRLGMTLPELVKTRPGVKNFGIFLPPERQKVDKSARDATVWERLPVKRKGDWQEVMYTVRGGRLTMVGLLAQPLKESYPPRRDAFVRSLVRRYGRPNSYAVVKAAGPQPTVVWQKEGVRVMASFTSWQTTPSRSATFFLNIATGRDAQSGLDTFVKLTDAQKAKVIAPLRQAVEKALRQAKA
jgi:hypothetical protein